MSRHFSSNQHLPQPEKIKQNVSESHDKRTIHNNKDHLYIYIGKEEEEEEEVVMILVKWKFFFSSSVSFHGLNTTTTTRR